jgi:hypothetical protein
MKSDPNHEPLLHDVFADAPTGTAEFGLLAPMLRHARRRRALRQARRGAVAVAALAAVAFGVRFSGRPSRSLPMGSPPPYALVRTEPLTSTAIVATVPLAPDFLVSTAGETRMVRSTSLGYSQLSDEELLTLVTPRPAVLVRASSGYERLVFVNPSDAEGFPAD